MNLEHMKMALLVKKLNKELTSSEAYLLGVIHGAILGAVSAAQIATGISPEEAETEAENVFDYEWQEKQWNELNKDLQLNARSFVEVARIIGNKVK